ncbi:MAG: hypothetical protein ACLGIO_10470 [Acidimicrobiia bacterium]
MTLVGCGDPDGASSASSTDRVPSPEPAASLAPCASPAVVADLGRPGEGGPPAEFTSSGGDIHVSAQFQDSGSFDYPGSTRVSVGPVDRPPAVDRQRGLVANVVEQVTVHEGEAALLRLPAGRYWLLSSNTIPVTLRSCEAGAITDVHRVP